MKYKAIATRDEGREFWLIEIPQLGKLTQARTIGEIEFMAADLASLVEDVDPDDVEIDLTIQLPDDVREHLDKAEHARRVATEANATAATEIRTVARLLADWGTSQRDIGEILGVSHQRAHQLLQENRGPA